jgi:putative DNA methylase
LARAAGEPELKPEERSVAVSALRHFDRQRYDVFAYVIMNDHVHVILTPLPGFQLQSIVGSWKSHTTYVLQRKMDRPGRVWQTEYYDRIVRDEAELIEKVEYILGNPWKRWPDLSLYPWVGCRGLEEQG